MYTLSLKKLLIVSVTMILSIGLFACNGIGTAGSSTVTTPNSINMATNNSGSIVYNDHVYIPDFHFNIIRGFIERDNSSLFQLRASNVADGPWSTTVWKNKSGQSRLVYVPSVGGHHIAVFYFDKNNGNLVWANKDYDLGKGSKPAEPRYLAISPDGKYAFVSDHNRRAIDSFIINTDESSADFGKLTMISSVTVDAGAPDRLIVDPNGKYLYVNIIDDNSSSSKAFQIYSINPSSGAIIQKEKAVATDGCNGLALTLSANNEYLYSSCQIVNNTSPGVIARYKLDPNGGTLQFQESITSTNPVSMIFTADGKFAYIANYNESPTSKENTISLYSVGTVGKLSYLSSIPITNNLENSIQPSTITTNPDNTILYIVSTPSGTMVRYKIGSNGDLEFLDSIFMGGGVLFRDVIVTKTNYSGLCGNNHDMKCIAFVATDRTWYGNMNADVDKTGVELGQASDRCNDAAFNSTNSSHLPDSDGYRDPNKIQYTALLKGREATVVGRSYYQTDLVTRIAVADSFNLARSLENPIYHAEPTFVDAIPIWTGFYADKEEEKASENCSNFTRTKYNCSTDACTNAETLDAHAPIGNANEKAEGWQNVIGRQSCKHQYYIACVSQ